MTTDMPPRRTRVERNIYKRPNGIFEVGFKDATEDSAGAWSTAESRPLEPFAIGSSLSEAEVSASPTTLDSVSATPPISGSTAQ